MEELNNIVQYMNLHGNKYNSPIILDDNLYNCIYDISNINTIDLNGIEFRYITKKHLKGRSKAFFDKYFKVHDVGLLGNNKLKKIFINRDFSNISNIINVYNNSALFLSPFELPIKYKYKELFCGTLVTQTLLTDNIKQANSILKGLNIYFSGIVLPSTCTDISVASYIHEITHSQIESNKGLVEDFNNLEMLSVFLELVYASKSNLNTLKIITLNRIEHLLLSYGNIIKNEEIKNSEEYFSYSTNVKYLKSILKAFNLFDKYLSNNNEYKKHVFSNIQKIFDDKLSVEEFLDKFDITYENSLDSKHVKKLVNKINKNEQR